MKVKVNVTKTIEIDVNEKVFNDLYKIHKADRNGTGTEKQYKEAMEKISEITEMPILPLGKEEPNIEYIFAVYAEDDIPILEI